MEPTQHAKKNRAVDLGALLDACDDAVVTLVAGDTRLVAHRAVLVDRSPVFAQMFRHDTLESRSGQVNIVDVEGPVLRQLLSYLYKLRVRLLSDMFVPAAGNSQQVLGGQSQGVALRKKIPTIEATQNAKEITSVDLGDLLDACDNAVVTLVAGDTRLVAHRAVLMDRSPVFAAMFRHDTLESRSGQVTIVDVEGPVLRQLLCYLYTLRDPQLPDMAAQLLVAADKYGVTSLTAACEQQLVAHLSVETAAAAAVLAVRHCCERLREASIDFLADDTRTHQVMASRGWADAMRRQPNDLMEVNRLLVAELRRFAGWYRNWRLIQAAKEGSVWELQALMAAGADVAAADDCLVWPFPPHDAVDGYRWTALHWAAAEGHVEMARRLLAYGVRVDARDPVQRTPLHLAARGGHAAVARLLLAASADRSARTKGGWTPLHLAWRNNHQQVVDLLSPN